MNRDRVACVALLALLFTGFEVRAVTSCAAGHPNTISVIEATPTSAFVINNDGTAIHTLTGLMWKRCAQGLSGAACDIGNAIWMNWQDALKAATLDTTGGYDDWRLPNKKELESIVETCGYDPAINLAVFPGTPWGAFWSSSTDAQSPDKHWDLWAVTGETGASPTQVHMVRLVRGGRTYGAFDARLALRCNLDLDGNGPLDALTDGLLFFRALFGLTGAAITNGAIGIGATRDDWAKLRTFMNERCGTNLVE
jgi:hypothetical protein